MSKSLEILLLATIACGLPLSLQATDKVKVHDGKQSNGTLTEITPTELMLELGATKKTFAINDVDIVMFDAEPADLTQARLAMKAGRFEDAVALLDKIDVASINREPLVHDIEFYKAAAAARLSLAGGGSKPEAGKKLVAFEKAHPRSFHYYETCEILGDLLAALGKFDQAESYFAKVAAAPWPDYKMRASVLMGRALLGQKQFDRALSKFDEVLDSSESGKETERQKLAAALGKAAAQAGAGQSDAAIKSIQQIIADADPENMELHARAYNVLGNAYKAAGKKKEALLAFLHVDLLYARFPEQHAEALANLATLWNELDKADRATQARNLLNEKYPSSDWATK